MPVNIFAFPDTEVDLNYNEPLTSKPVNEKFAGVVPSGIHRGFRLTTSGSNRTVTCAADPEYNDHLLVAETAAGAALTVRRLGGDFTVDLTAFAGTTVVLAVHPSFSVGPATVVNFRKYTEAEYNGLTNADRLELVVLGTVIVPAGATPIASANIRQDRRNGAWTRKPLEAFPWPSLLRNPSFEYGVTDAFDSRAAHFWESLVSVGSAQWRLRAGVGNTGDKAMVLRSVAAGAITASFSQYVWAPVRPGRRIRIQLFYNPIVTPTSGTLFEITLLWRQADGFVGGSLKVSVDLTVATGSYHKVDVQVVVPAAVSVLEEVRIQFTAIDWSVANTDVVRIDDLQLWTEPVSVSEPYTFEEAEFRTLAAQEILFGGTINFGSYEDVIALLKTALNGAQAELSLERRDGQVEPAALQPWWRPKGQTTFGENLVLGTSAEKPYTRFPYRQEASATRYTLLHEVYPNGALAGAVMWRFFATGTGDLVMTVNAKRSGTNWTSDDTTVPSFKLALATTSNMLNASQRLRVWRRDAGAGTWLDTTGAGGDWTRAALSLDLAGAAAGLLTVHDGRLQFTNPSLSNPANTVGISNTLHALTMPKAFGLYLLDNTGPGLKTPLRTANVASATANALDLTVVFTTGFINANCSLVFGDMNNSSNFIIWQYERVSSTTVIIRGIKVNHSAAVLADALIPFNFDTDAGGLSFWVIGEQT